MSVLTEQEFFTAVQDLLGDRTDEESLIKMENLTDTYSDMKKQLDNPTDWEKKYKELDEAWRKKYLHRFYTMPVSSQTVGGGFPFDPAVAEVQKEEPKVTAETIGFDDLFAEKKS